MRHQAIIAAVRKQGYASHEELARHFDVAVQTIRRDIRILDAAGDVVRHHGGASAPSSVENIAYSQRQIHTRREKEAIGASAARAVPDGASLFINIGTTTEAFARALSGHRGLQVITNNLHVASLLAGGADCRVVVTGGTVRMRDGGILGPDSLEMLARYRADYGVIGISGIDGDGTLLDYDQEEIRASELIRANSRKVFLLADHTKFGRRPLVRAGSIVGVDVFFTDRRPPEPICDLLAEHGVELVIADMNVRKRT
ncbi:DeoR/GlpR family DNA-binding transcription regulator [Acetobacter estunensis]|uniref:DeoR family transcriptional regulator n=1 Tax=Acetobacter estunensis TaxID=104097 RepID=A0A967BC13_9PROT|nr:DeoR family transcriptional regulator [Acetobacter estunensis]MBV1838343.1 DeoR family transcriptional regulator [Acetobacter estunensis]NHO54258.1 DeoR family transcriptional regulator [Acetobacter estunensis]